MESLGWTWKVEKCSHPKQRMCLQLIHLVKENIASSYGDSLRISATCQDSPSARWSLQNKLNDFLSPISLFQHIFGLIGPLFHYYSFRFFTFCFLLLLSLSLCCVCVCLWKKKMTEKDSCGFLSFSIFPIIFYIDKERTWNCDVIICEVLRETGKRNMVLCDLGK